MVFFSFGKSRKVWRWVGRIRMDWGKELIDKVYRGKELPALKKTD